LHKTSYFARTLGMALAALASLWSPATLAANLSAGDPARGEELYQGCMDCHSIEKNDVGPMHQGVVGRKAGTVLGYKYSPALRNANVVWTEDNLDKWLTSPQSFIPGTKMFYQVQKPQDRLDIIAYLKEHAK